MKKQFSKTIFIMGAEGIGKSSILDKLEKRFVNVDFHDFDELIVPPNPDLQWRLDTSLIWIRKALDNQGKNIPTCILGLCFPSELRSFPAFEKLNDVSFCLLDVNEEERMKRLLKRGASVDVVDDTENLLELRNQFKTIGGGVINTSKLDIKETFEEVAKFIEVVLK